MFKKTTPVETLAHIFTYELYGMMTCWCMSSEKFVPDEWVMPKASLPRPKPATGQILRHRSGLGALRGFGLPRCFYLVTPME